MRCQDCAKEITKEGGELRRPILRNRDGNSTIYASLVTVAGQVTGTVVGTTFSAPITIPDTLLINQLPGTSIKAHVCIKDVFIILFSDGTVTSHNGWLYYRDVFNRLHTLMVLGGPNNYSQPNIRLLADAAVTDAMPPDLGAIGLEINSVVFGTGTFIRALFRANIEIHYEQ